MHSAARVPPAFTRVRPSQRLLPGARAPPVARSVPCRARIGRGGRLVLDRVHPLTHEAYTTPDPQLAAPWRATAHAALAHNAAALPMDATPV